MAENAKAKAETKAKAITKTKRRAGRPSIYSEEIASEILTRIASGETLTAICRDPHLPTRTTVHEWVVDDTHGFAARYRHARESQLDTWADEIVSIADDATADYTVDGKGGKRGANVAVQRAQLRIESRKWLLSKLQPHVYGDRVQVAGTWATLDISRLTDEQLQRIAAGESPLSVLGSGVAALSSGSSGSGVNKLPVETDENEPKNEAGRDE